MRRQVSCGRAGDYLLNYISEINGFERWLETHQLPTLAQLLWYKIAYWSSRAGWPEWTQVDNRRLMVSLQIAREASLTESRERLVNAGLIEYKKGKKGSPGRYRIISFEEKATGYTYNMQVQNGDSDENTYNMKAQAVTIPVRKPVVYPGVQSVGIIKEKDKDKNKNKPLSLQVVEKRERGLVSAALTIGKSQHTVNDRRGESRPRHQNFDQDKVDYDALVLERVRARMAEGAGRIGAALNNH